MGILYFRGAFLAAAANSVFTNNENFIHPDSFRFAFGWFGVPLTPVALGGLLALLIFGSERTSFVGFVPLMGIAKKNAIM